MWILGCRYDVLPARLMVQYGCTWNLALLLWLRYGHSCTPREECLPTQAAHAPCGGVKSCEKTNKMSLYMFSLKTITNWHLLMLCLVALMRIWAVVRPPPSLCSVQRFVCASGSGFLQKCTLFPSCDASPFFCCTAVTLAMCFVVIFTISDWRYTFHPPCLFC